MKTHFDPYLSDIACDSEVAMCGTRLGEQMDSSNRWSEVDCKRCLSQRIKIDAEVARDEEIIVRQMGDFVDFIKQQEQAIL